MEKKSFKQMHVVLQGSDAVHKLVSFSFPKRGIAADKRTKFGLFILVSAVRNAVQPNGMSCASASCSYQGSL